MGLESEFLSDIYYHIGLCNANMEEYGYSIEPFTRAIEYNDLEPCYFHERAKSYLLTGAYQEAVLDFDKVIEFQPSNSHAFFGRAFAYKNLGNFSEAVSD